MNTWYVIDLVRAGWEGALSSPMPTRTALASAAWAPAAIGAIVGASTISLDKNRKSRYDFVKGGLVGGVLGVGCGLAWKLGGPALRNINLARDAHWLANNPIDYA